MTNVFCAAPAEQGASLVVLHKVHADRLGPFEREQLVTDLPAAPCDRWWSTMGSSAWATTAARLLLAAGSGVGRASSWAELVLAKLARRIMMWHGTIAGQGPPTLVAQRGNTSSDRGALSRTPGAVPA